MMSVPAAASPLVASSGTRDGRTLLRAVPGPERSQETAREVGTGHSRPAGLGLSTRETDKLIAEVFARHTQGVEAVEAFDDLNHALLLAREKGQEVPCLGPGAEAWTANDWEEQAVAADRCLDCPAMLLCKQYADLAKVNAGTWGGVTRDPANPRALRRRNACPKGHDLTQPGAVKITSRGWRRCAACRDESDRRAERRRLGRAGVRPRPQGATGPAPKRRDCACECGGKTRGGRYLPGHDARHLARLARYVEAGAMARDRAWMALAESPNLQARLLARLGE